MTHLGECCWDSLPLLLFLLLFFIGLFIFTSCADFGGKVVKTSVVFNKLGTVIPMSVDEGPESQGPVVS